MLQLRDKFSFQFDKTKDGNKVYPLIAFCDNKSAVKELVFGKLKERRATHTTCTI